MGAGAAFTISLDCEGFWGAADRPLAIAERRINQASLDDAYEFIYRTLDHAGVKATAAFVTCFAAGHDSVRAQVSSLRSLAMHQPTWFRRILGALEEGDFDGWDGSRYFRQFLRGGHEMAWHGATHMPLADDVPDAAIHLEMDLARALFRDIGQTPETVVFPRNVVGHLDVLLQAGFRTYRAGSGKSATQRAINLAREWNFLDSDVQAKPVHKDGWNVTPPGHFLCWPSGARSMVPTSVTVMRWKSLLRAAVNSGGYVHMWFHPHNLITAPAMKESFHAILAEVARLIRSGDLRNVTMEQANGFYADAVLS